MLDFRSYQSVDLEFPPGVTTLVGANGQGKTNLVEAISYVATLSSHRVATDAPLIKSGSPRAVVRSRVVRGDRASTVELEITQGRANRARINRGQLGRSRDVLGILRTVLFSPEDLALVKGDPQVRRRFIDHLIVQMLPRFASVFADYERVVRQRSALLKSHRAHGYSAHSEVLSTLDVWDSKLVDLGAQIMTLRQQVVASIQPAVSAAYEVVSGGQGTAQMMYSSLSTNSVDNFSPEGTASSFHMPREAHNVPLRGAIKSSDEFAGIITTNEEFPQESTANNRDALRQALTELRSREFDRGVSLVGPHRDDLLLRLNELPVKGYASHGESWSFALALRLASFWLLGGDSKLGVAPPQAPAFWDPEHGSDADPVLILDDVFAELDNQRRERLAQLVLPARQVFVTAAVPDDVPGALSGVRFHVKHGEVNRA